jgi:DNA polymerase (family 10)
MSEEALWRQIRWIDKLNEQGKLGVRVLKSAEVDILANGALDYSDELLKELDYTVCSIHSRFALGKKEQTERIMRAMDNRYFNILGHTTGRLLLKRPGYEVDWEWLIRHAAKAKVSFEINASPDRLDLSAEAAREVRAAGIKLSINTDAHHVKDFDYLYCGVDVARRAGLEPKDVLNCHPWAKVARMIKR